MARIIVGNLGTPVAISQARSILAELTDEWPDIYLSQRTISSSDPAAVFKALQNNQIQIAIVGAHQLPPVLPEGLILAAIGKRLEPRLAFISRAYASLQILPQQAAIACPDERCATFIRSLRLDLKPKLLGEKLDDNLAQLISEELAAIIMPSADLIQLNMRHHITGSIEPEVLPPAAASGSIAFVVQDTDDLANEIAYTMHHRPSAERISAERSFADAVAQQADYAVGALASLSSEGDLSLFGAISHQHETLVIQAEISGEASEAQTLGKELAQDVLEQAKARS